jgi:hypothetical protein
MLDAEYTVLAIRSMSERRLGVISNERRAADWTAPDQRLLEIPLGAYGRWLVDNVALFVRGSSGWIVVWDLDDPDGESAAKREMVWDRWWSFLEREADAEAAARKLIALCNRKSREPGRLEVRLKGPLTVEDLALIDRHIESWWRDDDNWGLPLVTREIAELAKAFLRIILKRGEWVPVRRRDGWDPAGGLYHETMVAIALLRGCLRNAHGPVRSGGGHRYRLPLITGRHDHDLRGMVYAPHPEIGRVPELHRVAEDLVAVRGARRGR